jgi:predicted glycosyltransferase
VRVLCYAQHLTGVGHFVRMHLIAQGLAHAHDVHLIDGGRLVPRPRFGPEPTRVRIPTLQRDADGTLVGEGGVAAPPILAARLAQLRTTAEAFAPDVVLVDHYPFSKWELHDEITGMIDGARAANPSVRVLCSLRDIAPQTAREQPRAGTYVHCVRDLLAERFDGVLVHADPSLVRLEDHFPDATALKTTIVYTGYVAERASPRPDISGPYAVLSAGGLDSDTFLTVAVDAFHATGSAMPLHVFTPPGVTLAKAPRVITHAFSGEFSGWLAGAALSISRAGYNTCAGLLATRVPAVLVPDGRLSDQIPRAGLLAGAGLAHAAPEDEAAIAAAITAALAQPPVAHSLDLTGVATTRAIVESAAAVL